MCSVANQSLQTERENGMEGRRKERERGRLKKRKRERKGQREGKRIEGENKKERSKEIDQKSIFISNLCRKENNIIIVDGFLSNHP